MRGRDSPTFRHPFLPNLLHNHLRENVACVHSKAGEHFLVNGRASNWSLTSPALAFGNNDISYHQNKRALHIPRLAWAKPRQQRRDRVNGTGMCIRLHAGLMECTGDGIGYELGQ